MNHQHRTSVPGSCSTCGQYLPEARLLIDLNSNSVSYGAHSVRLRPRDAEVLKVLQEASPRFISRDFIEERIVGQLAETRCPEWVRVRVSMLRKRLKGLPIRIQNRHGVGYRLLETV
jgi:DNA-binding response OmpR family regulator